MCAPEVCIVQLLYELGVVETLHGALLDGLPPDGLRASAAAEMGAGLVGLARGLVYDVPFEDGAGLHGSEPREYLQDLLMARRWKLAVQQQLVHGEDECPILAGWAAKKRTKLPWSGQ